MYLLVWAIVGVNWSTTRVLWLPHSAASWLCDAVFHVLLVLLLASYHMCVFIDPGTVPMAWHRLVEAEPSLAGQHVLCRRSKLYRPLRSHFCSITRRPVLNMDHFCPWVINCVGFYNRKFFVLFLGCAHAAAHPQPCASTHTRPDASGPAHRPPPARLCGADTFLATTFVLATTGPKLARAAVNRDVKAMSRLMGGDEAYPTLRYVMGTMAFLLDAALAIMLLCFGGFHLRMVTRNETTIEGNSPEFDVGRRRNWEQVFGTDARLWFLPVWGGGPAGDGVHWPSPLVKRLPPPRELEGGGGGGGGGSDGEWAADEEALAALGYAFDGSEEGADDDERGPFGEEGRDADALLGPGASGPSYTSDEDGHSPVHHSIRV